MASPSLAKVTEPDCIVALALSSPTIKYYNLQESESTNLETVLDPNFELGIFCTQYTAPPADPNVVFTDLRWVDADSPDTADIPDWTP